MAGIDKTYTNSYEEYIKFKNWADMQFLTFFDGYKVCIGDWVWDWTKENFDGRELPIMNTPTWLDIYLIQNCKIKFVLDRMKDVYGKDSYKKFKIVNLSDKPSEEFQQNRKIVIKNCNTTKFPIHNKPYGKSKWWWIQCNDYFSYNDETKRWVSSNSYYHHNTNTAHITSIKSLVRHLRKQYLPKDITFTVSGKYMGEEYQILIK